ncbi:phospho-N-acetylmuramoyl-pentapeptide-transferase [Candidatus Chlorohelix allophototropha]|uniref:Phospho-N-acetylmuramoyl-pentapeptide-transferase n=2 Tax=Candidatus Chlorohelix allophototropha TaxID=3003348 RepID=A0ABY9AZS8_9CHLR|nr:phospho-N-acetylmuramoyl-pentapeptide-transferase [Chloroflexota bacterium L227-S17]
MNMINDWSSQVGWLLGMQQYEIVGQSNPGKGLETPVMIIGLLLSALAFLVSWAIGKPLLVWLKAKKIGKRIRLEGPESHMVKSGTPTMGGLMIIGSILIVTVIFNLLPTGRLSVLLPIGMLIACGLLGAVDDMLSLVGREGSEVPVPGENRWQRLKREWLARRGLTARFKLAWLLVMSLVAAIILFGPLELQKVYVPFVREPLSLGWVYVPIATIVIAGMANAVNLTDGLDTLAGSTCATAFVAYAIIGFLQEQPQVVLLGFTAAGACLGFLWYNAHPAQVFMGDTGSLTLGALLAILAFQTNQWLLLPLIGGIFILEMASVVLQVFYFKWTDGKRLFKMAPLHHHFEKSGWSETQVTMRFWLFSLVMGMIGVALALL